MRRGNGREPERDAEGSRLITIPASLASGAHQAGEETELFVYLVARALDCAGAGRVEKLSVAREIRTAFRGGHANRIFEREKGSRYWELDRGFLRLRSTAAVVGSFDDEVADWPGSRTFPVRLLDTRGRRGAAMLAAVLAGHENPRSNAFISRFSRVDRKTIGTWMKDPVIETHILVRTAEWAV